MKKKRRIKFWWCFDRAFYDNKQWKVQIGYLFLFIAIATLICWPIGSLFIKPEIPNPDFTSAEKKFKPIEWIIAMIVKGKIMDERSPFTFGFQVFMIFVGSFISSGFIFCYVNNILKNRMDSYRNGSVRYRFSDHILFLGGSKMILPMLKELYKHKENLETDIVILANDDAVKIRREIYSFLNLDEKRSRIIVLRGPIDDEDSLKSVHIDQAARIYIIGENPIDPEHDSVCMACWNLAKKLCCQRKDLPCYLMFNRASSAHLFRRRPNDQTLCLNTTLINRLESVAQKTLVHNTNDHNPYPALDRDGITSKDDRTVHVVLYGMTDISYAMATTAAHLCHFPNFVNDDLSENLERRTKITFIAPNIKEEMAFLTSHLNSLFSISKHTYINSETSRVVNDHHSLNQKYGDFLDIEWEFVDGNIAEPWVRDYLTSCYQKNQEGKTYLSLFICQREPDKNIGASLYLPNQFHEIHYKEGTKEIDFTKTIPIFVYQHESEEMLHMANSEIDMFGNLFPFGSIKESYDPSIRRRISEGKKINYIYKGKDHYTSMTKDQAMLDRLWRDLTYTQQMSNIYGSMHINVKLRSLGDQPLNDKNILRMAVVEHNRWNIEKLLMGYEAIPKEERQKQYDHEQLELLKSIRETQFRHYCIAPYNELLPEDKKNDLEIIKNLEDIYT